MTDVTIVAGATSTAADSIEAFYTSPQAGNGTLITAFAAVNGSGANASYLGYIYDKSGTALNAIIPIKKVVKNKTDIAPGITNQMIPPGGTLRMESSRISSISWHVSGIEL